MISALRAHWLSALADKLQFVLLCCLQGEKCQNFFHGGFHVLLAAEPVVGTFHGDEFDQMERLSALTGVAVPANLSGLREKPERHTGVIDKEEMLEFVLNL